MDALSANIQLLAYAVIAFDAIFVVSVVFELLHNNKDRTVQEEVRKCVTSLLVDSQIEQLIDRRIRLKKLADADENSDGKNVEGK